MSTVEITYEPLTYRADGEYSYFRDRVTALREDAAARRRLERHAAEMDVELPRRDAAAYQRAVEAGVELRTNPNRTPGTGGYFAPPLWIIDGYAGIPRAPRVLANLAPTFPLPGGVQSVNIPRLTAGGSTSVVADDTAESDTDITDAGVTSPVVTISGEGVVAQQLLDQSPPSAGADWAFFKDLTESYDEQLETQLLYGAGTSGEFAGITKVGTTASSYTATPDGATMYAAFCQLLATVADARKHKPGAFLMRTARWMWIAAQTEAAAPLIGATLAWATGPVGPDTPIPDGKIAATTPVYFDEAITTSLGAGTNQDQVIACVPSDLMLFEGTPSCTVNVDTAKSGNLQARLVFRNYVAFLAGRYPSGIGTLTGTGFVVATGF